MARKMLINALRPQELRVAIVDGGRLEEYQVSVAESGSIRGNVYRGIVVAVNPSLDAAFVELGEDRQALLPAHDVVREAYHRSPGEGTRRPRIDRILERGRPVLVQVTRDSRGGKGPAVTTNISLAGRYLVLMPYADVHGISRKVEDEEERRRIREVLEKVSIPQGFGFIVRTAALDQPKSALNRDLNALVRLWKRIRSEAQTGTGPKLLYSDQDLIVQAVRDLLDSSVEEVLVDDAAAYEKVRSAMRAFMPRSKIRVVHYTDRLPLFSRFELQDQIEAIFRPRVELPSGGSIVIEGTEALTAIDVNSGRSTRGGSEEETAYRTNLEAVAEVARQLRLRDIGGLIVVDLIDMRSAKHRREVEKALKEALRQDRARVAVGRISPNGLLEINRQRLKTPLVQRTHRLCPTCGGRGRIPSPETVSLDLMRRIEERAVQGAIAGVRIRLHPELADAFQNRYRHELAELEREFDLRIEIVAAAGLHRSEQEVEWFQRDAVEREPAGHAEAAVNLTEIAAEAAGPAPDDARGEDRPARRKRRGRRRRKARSDSSPDEGSEPQEGEPEELPAPSSEPEAAPEPAPAPEEDAAAPEPPPQEGEGAARRRRRRRRPRRRKATESPEPATGS